MMTLAWPSLVAAALGALGFFLPFSAAGVSISLFALVVLALFRPRAVWQQKPWQEPVMGIGLLLLAYITVHTLWVTGTNQASVSPINHYQELLFAPLLLALMVAAGTRTAFLRGLMIGAALLAAAQWLAMVVPELGPLLLSRRISSGFALAVCAYLVLMQARGQPRPWPARAFAAFLALTVLFAIDGRTGHVVLLVLVGCAAWQYSPRRWRLPATLAGLLVVVALAMTSGAVGSRLQETVDSAREPGTGAGITSTAIRVELMRLGVDLSRRYGLTGAGFANYKDVHRQAANERYGLNAAGQPNVNPQVVIVGNPHNEYFMELISGGGVALVLFLGWLGVALVQGARARAPVGGMLAGCTLAFAVGCLFNSMLYDYSQGHLYMGLLAWLLAERRHGGQQDRATAPVQRVLVIATRQIGDVLLTTPLVRAARQRWPEARIDVLGFAGTLGMLRGNPDVNELIETAPRLGWRNGWALLRRLWRGYDLALVTDPGDRAHLMGWIAAPERSGIVAAEDHSAWWKKTLLAHAVPAAGDRGSVHVTREKLSLLAPWLPQVQDAVPQVVPPAGTALPASVQSQLQRGAVVLHAPSMWPYKQWPLVHFEMLVKELLARGHQILLTGSAGSRDQECVAALRHLGTPPQLLDLSGQLDFNQLVTLFENAALYIGPDTSVSHLAAATGIPVIAIFGPTNPMRWAPWPAKAEAQALFARSSGMQQVGNVTVLQSSLSCVPCGRAGCEDHRQSRSDCLIDITPERVLAQALQVLGATRRRAVASA